ncbi:MAG: protein-L-isoaspartate(D-aspartate) O-methyltransferase [Pigmentiphaga sp.]|uniref:protein-L-isoaspartate(D-aspartate) O-methyltransferase n=1 Tax=Pigmentiphaga sp. TaxID=1977564 RepID=UPI0029BD132E|nr:protein-L-isoaspartate(D-aspartate) O-methyltransferase [Pigmentiphaga sp.]MDX3905509.1 protein-L-isoaspartate(D-aspartate) O-methyltransferase [Pigmentiphaga sp.]
MAEPDPASQRESMVAWQLAGRGITDPAVLAAMRRVPRENFVPAALQEFAYEDAPLPIGGGQTISQPYVVALMAAEARLSPQDHVLDIGTGSGYAAAVLAQIVARVDTVELRPELAEQARERLADYPNVDVHIGDGTLGWPARAPFDAILAAAGGPEVPAAWREQLAPGGRLIMPVGASRDRQRLVRVVRTAEGGFSQEDLGGVRFVPLIGVQGWQGADEDPAPPADPRRASGSAAPPREALGGRIRAAAEPLNDLEEAAASGVFDRWSKHRVVLLGEASHGTSEFYQARAAITRRLIEHHGFNIVAVEADWPDAAAIDRYVRLGAHRPDAPSAFRRFPTWMWRNTDVYAFVEWLRAHNASRAESARAGFFGLDLYSLSDSMAAVLAYLERVDPQAARVARERYGCLTPWQKNPAVYGRAVVSDAYRGCEAEVVAQLSDLLARRMEYAHTETAGYFDAAQNARLVASAERYYRAMYYGSAESWNLRDTHMFETLAQLIQAHGPGAKAVVWAHNSHIGNAAATEMGRVRGELNIGQLCRERYGDEAALVGMGTHTGTVAAAHDWGGPMEVMEVVPSREDSYEFLSHASGIPRFLLDLRAPRNEALARELSEPRLERYIGVIYRPQTELMSHYADASLPDQFDAWLWMDRTRAVEPLAATSGTGMPETYPFGV